MSALRSRPFLPDREHAPLVESVGELVGAAIEEAQTGSGYEVDDGAGDQDVARSPERRDARADVGHEPFRRARGEIALAGVQAHA